MGSSARPDPKLAAASINKCTQYLLIWIQIFQRRDMDRSDTAGVCASPGHDFLGESGEKRSLQVKALHNLI